jgi:hypothetical protein
MDVTTSLWIRLAGRDAVWLIDGNPHTHQGRMRAVDPETGDTIFFSLSEVIDASDVARAWIDGFLAGSEPSATSMFGVGILDDDEGPRWGRWRAAIADYRRTGEWPHEPWAHLLPLPDGADVPPHVWTVRGDEVWRWIDGEWTLADPQPARSSTPLAGTLCQDRAAHSMVVASTAHLVCEDCGRVMQFLPEEMTAEQFEREQYTYGPKLIDDE